MNKEIKKQFDIKSEEVYKRLELLGYEKERVLGIFLYGSQNYGLSTESSDFDFKVIVFPTLKDLLFKRSTSKTYQLNDKEEDQIEVKDLQTMMDMWRKGNPAYIEILDTPYFHTNYKDSIEELRTFNPATVNNLATINALYGMALQKLKALDHPYPSKIDVIEKYGYDSKQLYHIIRLNYILEKAAESYRGHHNVNFNINDYAFNLPEELKEEIFSIKKYEKGLSIEEAKKIAEDTLDNMKQIKTELLDVERREFGAIKFNTNIWDQMNEWMVYNLTRNLKEQIKNA